MKVYIAGPMTGIKDWNTPLFAAVAKRLRRKGWEVISPVEMDEGDHEGPWATYLTRDLNVVMTRAEAVAVLPGWYKSKGTRLEIVAALTVGIPVYYADTMEELNSYWLMEVISNQITGGDPQ